MFSLRRSALALLLALTPLLPTATLAQVPSEDVSRGTENMQIHDLVINPVNPTILYAGTNGGIFRYDLTPFAK